MSSTTVFEKSDNLVAARTASLICLVAGLWFFVSPWAYYGVSADPNAWNAWLVGAIIVVFGIARSCAPTHVLGLSYLNALLGIWIILSPWVFGYTSDTPHFVNSLAVGAFVLAFSIISVRAVRNRV